MLVLSTKVGQRILLGPDIVVTLCGLQAGKARIGIDAPIECSVTLLREGVATVTHRQSRAVVRAVAAESKVERLNAEIERLTFELERCKNERAA